MTIRGMSISYNTELTTLHQRFASIWSAPAWGDLETSYACVNLFPSVNNVSWWQSSFESSRRIFINEWDLVSGLNPYTQDSSPLIMVFIKSGSLFLESSMYCETSTRIAYALLQSFRHFPYNENPTRALNTVSLKCYLPSTFGIHRWKQIHACAWRFKAASCKRASFKFTIFLQKKKDYTFLTE